MTLQNRCNALSTELSSHMDGWSIDQNGRRFVVPSRLVLACVEVNGLKTVELASSRSVFSYVLFPSPGVLKEGRR